MSSSSSESRSSSISQDSGHPRQIGINSEEDEEYHLPEDEQEDSIMIPSHEDHSAANEGGSQSVVRVGVDDMEMEEPNDIGEQWNDQDI